MANLDVAVIAVPVPPRSTVIDRYLDMVVAGGSRPVLCIKKIEAGEVFRALADPSAGCF